MNDLIVPIRDRRQRKRILTLKTFGRFAIAFAVLFAGLTIQSEIRHPHGPDYGRLFGKQVARQNDIKPKYEVVKEAPVTDQTKADALLAAPAARSQYLIDNANATPVQDTRPRLSNPQPNMRSGVTIVGDGSGVTIVRNSGRDRPVLSGGIFKQP